MAYQLLRGPNQSPEQCTGQTSAKKVGDEGKEVKGRPAHKRQEGVSLRSKAESKRRPATWQFPQPLPPHPQAAASTVPPLAPPLPGYAKELPALSQYLGSNVEVKEEEKWAQQVLDLGIGGCRSHWQEGRTLCNLPVFSEAQIF